MPYSAGGCLIAAERLGQSAAGHTHVRYHRELNAGEKVDVSCAYIWGEGKTFRVEQGLRRADGPLVGEITNVGGLLDLQQRRLLPEPSARWRSVATKPELLGLGPANVELKSPHRLGCGYTGMPAAESASRSRRAVATDTSSSSAGSAAVTRPRACITSRVATSRSARTATVWQTKVLSW